MNASNDKPDFERLLKVLWMDGEPDRVPFYELFADPEVIEAVTGEQMTKAGLGYEALRRKRLREGKEKINSLDLEKLKNAQKHYIGAIIKFYHGLKYDYIPLGCSGLEMPGYSDERWKWTNDTADRPHEQRTWLREDRGLIENREDFRKYPWPNIGNIQTSPLYDLAVKKLPPGMGIIAGQGGTPFTLYEGVSFIMGAMPFFKVLYTDPSLVKDMFDKIGSYAVACFKLNAEREHVGACLMADDMGYRTGPMMAPKHFKEYVFPWIKKCADAVHKRGKPFILHSCGNLKVLMDDLIDYVGIDAKHSFEDTTYPVTEYKRLYGNRIALLGGISVDKLSRMPNGEFRVHVREIIGECALGGGYALGSGNSVTNYMRLENYLAMLDVGRRHGRYPIK